MHITPKRILSRQPAREVQRLTPITWRNICLAFDLYMGEMDKDAPSLCGKSSLPQGKTLGKSSPVGPFSNAI